MNPVDESSVRRLAMSSVPEMAASDKAQAALRESEEKLRGLFELSPLGIARNDMSGRFVEFNEAFCKICGYTADELRSLDYWVLTPKKYAADEQRQLDVLARTGQYGPYEKEYVHKDGRHIPLRLNGILVTGCDGEKYIWSIVEDITEQKLAQRRLEEERQRFIDFSSSSADWFWEMDSALRFTYLSPNFETVYGLNPQLLLGRTRAELLATDNLNPAEHLAAHLLEIEQHLPFRNFEYRIRDASGAIRWVVTSGVPVSAANGTFAGYRGLGQIVTRQKLAEEALRESEERFRTLADFNYDWEYWIGPDRRIIYSSSACEGITGYSAAEFVADPELTVRIVHPEDQHLIEEHYHHFADAAETSLDFRIINRNGDIRWIAHGCRPVIGTDGQFRGRRVSNRDITERKRIESELANTRESLSLAMEATSLSLWDYDIAEGVVLLDSHWPRLVGGPAGEAFISVGELSSAIHPDDAPRLAGIAVELFKRKKPTFQEEFRFRTPAGSWIWLRCSGKVTEWTADGRAKRAIGTNLDISERKAAEEEVKRWAFLDRLTNLPNRRLLEDRLHQEIAVAQREQRRLGLLFIDLDRFKPINDEFGHDMGDWLLQAVAHRMRACVRDADTVARMGGDEFVALLPSIEDVGGAVKVAQKLRSALEKPFIAPAGITLSISASIGIAAFPDHAVNAADLLRRGDAAMYSAKKAGRNGVAIADSDDGRAGPAPIVE